MGFNLAQDWPVYVLLSVAVLFFIYVMIHSWRQEIRDKEDENKKNSK